MRCKFCVNYLKSNPIHSETDPNFPNRKKKDQKLYRDCPYSKHLITQDSPLCKNFERSEIFYCSAKEFRVYTEVCISDYGKTNRCPSRCRDIRDVIDLLKREREAKDEEKPESVRCNISHNHLGGSAPRRIPLQLRKPGDNTAPKREIHKSGEESNPRPKLSIRHPSGRPRLHIQQEAPKDISNKTRQILKIRRLEGVGN